MTRTLQTRPDPEAHRQQLAPRCRHPDTAYKNVRFGLELCTSDPVSRRTKMHVSARRLAHSHRNPPASQSVHNSPPVGGRFPPVSKPFQLWNSLKTGRGTKMYASPYPCTPQRHHGARRRRKDLKDPSRMKAPARPVLKDPSRMKAPAGGYAGGLDCSHSQTALAKGPGHQDHGKR